MPFSPATYEEKPYNRCIDCMHIGKKCDGPNFLAMETPRLCEWARLRKDYLHSQNPKWTNAYIANEADTSKTTVDRFLAGDMDDLKLSTAARIIKVLVNGTWGQYPCALAAMGENFNPAIIEQCRQLQATLNDISNRHKEDIAAVKAEAQTKIDFLRGQVEFKQSQMDAKDKIIDKLMSKL